MAQIVFYEPSTLDLITKYLSPVPTNVVNVATVFPLVKQPQITSWDQNVQFLQSLPTTQLSPKNVDWLISPRQGVKYNVEFNQKNRVVYILVKSKEFPQLCKKLRVGEINLHKFDNQRWFWLIEYPSALTQSGKIEIFLVATYSFRHKNQFFRSVIRVTDLNNLKAFVLNENKIDLSQIGVKCNNFVPSYVISQSGNSYLDSTTFHHYGKVYLGNDVYQVALLRDADVIGILDDKWLIYYVKTESSGIFNRHYYSLNIITKAQQQIASHSSTDGIIRLFLVGKGFILILVRLKDSQQGWLLNVETNEKYTFPSRPDFGRINSVYVVSPGVLKFNYTGCRTYTTYDITNEKLNKV